MKRLVAIAALGSVVLGGCGQPLSLLPRRVELAGTTSVRVPVELVNHLGFVRARVGDGPPLLGLLDTGAGGLLLTPHGGEVAHIPTHRRTLLVNGVDGTEQRSVPVAKVRELHIARITLDEVHALVVPDLAELGQVVGEPVDLVVGSTLFGDNLVTIDLERGALTVEQGVLPQGPTVLEGGFASDVPHVRITVAGVSMSATVDTGCSGWLALPNELESQLPLKRPARPGPKHIGVNGEGRDRWARLDGEVQIGPHVLVDTPVDFTAGEPRICAQLLRYFRVTIDQRRGRVRFEGDARIVVPAERTTGLGLLKRNGVWIVADLIPGIAPDGIALFDVVERMGGTLAAPLTRADWIDAQRADVVHLTLLRDGKRLEVDVTVREVGSF
ncbi:MAG: aspartyl protease family protein [Polyangia bacterium]